MFPRDPEHSLLSEKRAKASQYGKPQLHPKMKGRVSRLGKYGVVVVLLMAAVAFAQDQNGSGTHDMSTMPCASRPDGQKADMGCGHPAQMHAGYARTHTFIETITQHATSGTSVEPNSTPASMLMTMKDGWMLMFHGEAFLNGVQQSGLRGADKFFSTNWFMPMAQRKVGRGTFTVRTMLSLEPATVTHRYYPELFQQGETAFGKPIVDGQHPHDFIMELAALYDLKIGEHGLFSLYFAPVGDPAMGPTAYPHRASASEDPIAPLGHHLEDSTHIADDVITAGMTYKLVRLEASGFHGREPDEFRWDIDSGNIDSWSLRATVNPAENWSAQYSFGYLASPEALHPGEDLDRMTASIMYNRPLVHGNWANTLLWGRNSTSDGLVWNGYLAESTLRFAERNFVWGRIEDADRTDELLLPNQSEPPGLPESIIGRAQAYTLGYDRDFMLPHLRIAPGIQFTAYTTPNSLKGQYGSHPFGAVMFLRIRPR